MNTCCLIGRLTADPIVRETKQGTKVAHFSLAVEAGKDLVDFIPFEAWDKTAEFVERFTVKGQRIGVQGAIKSANYTDKDGNKRQTYTVRAARVFFCDGKKHDKPESGEAENPFIFGGEE